VFVTPPYPQSLRGYADTFEQKIQAHFLLKDLSTGGRPFVLRFSLEDFQGQTIAQTPDYITPYLVNLSPGVRRTLTNIDFKTLLRYENLYGINEATYNGLLPEGTYFIGLSLYDVATGRPVSNKGRAMIQVRRYSPPVLTMPQKGEVLTKKNAFQHIVFQWMPRDVVPFMQYEFTLKEVWDLALVPEEAFMTGRLVYQTKTFSPALAYTNMMPILLENKRYVWQVRAFTNNPNNPNEQSYFKNNGNSETFYFDLVSHCEAPKFLTAITESTSAQLRWSAQAMMPNQEYPYKVMYREKGKTWKSQKVSMPYAKVTGLKRGRTYIYKVGVACGLETAYSSSVFGEESYMYSTEQEFTTTEQIDEKSQVQCGVKPEIRIKNTNPLQDNLYPNTTFTAGDFPVTVLNATGNNGIYSGEGYVKVPYLQDTKIKVVFNGIKLNTERQLIEGKLVTTYDETERNVEFLQEAFGEIFGDKGKKDQKMPFEVSEVQVDTLGRIIVIGKVDPKTGIAPKVTLPKGRDYVITDNKGKVYQLDESGKVTAEGTREEGTQLAQQAGKGESKNPPISNKHFKVEWLFNDELANDTTREIPYKALVKGKTSSFELRIQPADTTKYDFFFHTENGVKVDAESKGEGLYKITRKGAFDFAQEELWVVAKEKKDKKGKKEELIGKCILVHLSPKEVNVALVPTQSGQNLQEAIAKVQQIYEKVGVTLHITTEKPFDISDQLKNGTLPTENEFGDLSTYSPEQNAVIAKFTTNRKPKENTYYIFLVNDGTGDHGYMRLGGQYGFVYSANARTIAHELGHGIFKLEHPFKGKNADKGKTSALMDYNEEQDFFYRDWKQINDPKVKLYAFQGQSEGEFAGKIWLTPDWRPFKYDRSHITAIDREELSEIPQGALPAILGEDKKAYYAEFSNEKFVGYKNLDGLFLKLDYQTSINDKTEIYLYRTGNSCGSDTYYKTSWGYIKDKKGTVSFTVTPITFVNTVTCTNANPTVSPCDNFRVIKTSDPAEIEQYRKDLKEYLANAIKKIATSRKKEVVAVGQYNHIVNNFVTNVPEKQLYELEEKLHLLSYYTKIDVVLTFLPLRKNSYIPEHILSDLAQKAIEGVSGNKSDRKLVYLVVASSEYESIFKEGTIKKLNCHTISFAQTDNSIIRSKYKGNSIFEKLLTLYQDIPKPLIMNKYYQYADGSVRNYTYKSKENLRGYPFIKKLTFYQSKEFRRNKYCVYTSDYPELYQNCENQNRKALIKSLKAEYAQDGLKNKALWEEVDIHQLGRFREVYMDYGIDKTPNYPLYLWQNSVDTWQFKNKVKIALEKGTLPPEVFYDFEKLKVLDDAVYGTLDFISLIPGADIFTDPLCAAYASARNDATNLTIYSAGAILPLASGAYIRGGAKALNEEIMVVVAKKADNDEVELVYKNINDIAPNELYIATTIDNKQTQAFLDETKKQLDLHSINTQLDNLGKAGKQIANLAEDLSKKTNNILTKAFSEGSKFIDDKKTIEKITHYLAPENAEKLKAIGGEQGLIDFLKKYKDAPCGNCKDAGRKIFGGRTIDEMLENYVEVAHTFRNRPDLWKKIEEGVLSSNAAMREGTQHMLSTFKKNPKKYTPENIEHIDMKFEKGLDDICANCRYDVKFISESKPLYEEFKSYNSETWSKIANDKGFIQQFKSYLQTSGVKNIDDLAYVINSNKANINEVKQAFKELFKHNTDEIFKTNPNIWKQFERVDGTGKINSLKNFKDLVEDISFDTKHPIFNFIKAE